jgi:hypothetical protein
LAKKRTPAETLPADDRDDDTIVHPYPLPEAVLTQLGRDYAESGQLVPFVDLRFRDAINFFQLAADRANILQALGDMRRLRPKQHDRLVSLWHWRDHPTAVGLRDWLQTWRPLDHATLMAARDRLSVLSRLDPDLVDVLPLTDVLACVTGTGKPRPAPEPSPDNPATLTPKWDRAARVLTIGRERVTVASREAPRQFAVLDLLETAGWPQDGVAVPRDFRGSLKDTVEVLNGRLMGYGLTLRREDNDTRLTWTVAVC